MKKYWYRVTLKSDVVVTANAASEGPHESLDFLPGSVFLGAVAAACKENRNEFPADMLLSGSVRFTDAKPLCDTAVFYPVPLNWHMEKGTEWEGKTPITDLSAHPEKQYEQLRKGYVSPNGTRMEIEKETRLKSAVDRTRGASKEGQMFAYESIPAGMEYLMSVHADEESHLKEIDKILNNRTLFVGRSRSAEYGMVFVVRVDDAKLPKDAEPKMMNLAIVR